MLRETLAAQLARYDDDAFAALASRGLLRRAAKDLEKAAATVAEDGAEVLVMAFAGHRIRFDARGPAHARCSCPAGGACQHVLAAALTLQRAAQVPAEAPDSPAADPLAALEASLAAIDDAALVRHAGRPGYRWAWQFVQDLDIERDLRIGGERHLVLEFARPRIGLRYMGGGLDGLVADAALSQPAKYRVAALLAWRRLRGLAISVPEAPARRTQPALGLGEDHEAGTLADPSESRARLRQAVQQLAAECVGLGLSHLSQGIGERLATLAVWAQGADYPRLSLLLRRAADHVELLLDRAGGADERRLLDELTIACALAQAMESAAARGATPVRLAGRARTRYEGTGTLEVIGLGAHAWRSASGYVGLTMLFWSPTHHAFMSCSDARPESLRGFDPLARYRAAGPWSGLGAPQQATGHRLQLSGAQANHQGRLSATPATSVLTMAVEDSAALHRRLPLVASWADLAAPHHSLLDEAQPMKDWAVLAPARFGTPSFDAARQVLAWPLHDADGRVLHAELAWTPRSQHAIARIEGLARLAAGTCVVARVAAGGSTPERQLIVEPLSLVHADTREGQCAVDALHFDPPRDGDGPTWLQRLAARRGASTPSASPADAPRLPAALRELRHWLQSQAERGIGEGREASVKQALAEHARQCADAGFTAFGAARVDGAAALAILQLNYLWLQLERLATESSAQA